MSSSGVSNFLQRLTTRDEGPGSFAQEYKAIWRGYLYSIPIPFLFIVFKLNSVALLTPDQARLALSRLSYVDPALGQHYFMLTKLGRTTDLSNYPVFIAFMFLSLCIPVGHACCIYFRRWRIMLRPHPAAFFLIALIGLLYYALEVLGMNSASQKFRSVNQLYFDNYGLYYFYEAAFLFVYAIGLLLLVLTVLHTFSVIHRTLSYRIS